MFELIGKDASSKARRGRLTTGHGVVETPAYMPVGTRAFSESHRFPEPFRPTHPTRSPSLSAWCRLALRNLPARSYFNSHFAEQPERKKLRHGGKEHLHGEVAANFQRIDDGNLKTSSRVIGIQEQDQHRQPAQTLSITLLK